MGTGNKIFLYCGYSSLFPFILIAVIAHIVTYTSCKKHTLNHLISLRELKKREVEDYFTSIRKQICTISEDRLIVEATRYFTDNSPITTSVQLSPLAEKQYRLEKRNRDIAGLTLNNQEIKQYHHFVTEYCKRFGNFETFIAEPYSGKIVFSNSHELDFSISLLFGPYSKINFGRAFQLAKNSSNPRYVGVTDFEYTPPSYNNASSFVSSPIYDGAEKVGVLICKIPIEGINAIMTNIQNLKSGGLGISGNVYIVGEDLTLRGFFSPYSEKKDYLPPQLQRVDIKPSLLDTMNQKSDIKLFERAESEGARAALSGVTGVGMSRGYRSVPVMSAYAPLHIEDLNWGIVSEIDKTEVFATVYVIRKYSFVIGGAYLAFLTTMVILSISRNKQSLKKRGDGVGQNLEKCIFSPSRIRSRDLGIIGNRAELATVTDLNSENIEKTSDFLKRCSLCSEREDNLANECMDVLNDIKNTIAKQSKQLYYICDTSQNAIYGQDDRYNIKKVKKGRPTNGLVEKKHQQRMSQVI